MSKLILTCLKVRLAIVVCAFLSAVVFASSSLLAANCEKSLSGKKLDRRTLGAGATLRLKPTLKGIRVLDNGYTGTEPVTHLTAYAPDIPLGHKEEFQLPPGQQLRTLGSVFKVGTGPYQIRVELLPTGEPVMMYWVDVFNNALLEQAGEAKDSKPKAVKHKFPNSWDRFNEDRLWKKGHTAWGRPKAEIGQMVWIANHSRVMGRGSVGVLQEIDPHSIADVRTLDNKTKPAYHSQCVPLTDEEIAWFTK